MRLIDADTLVEAILDARREETDTIPKLIRFIEKRPTAEPNCADGCIYGWGSDECEKCRFKCEPKRGRWEITDDTAFRVPGWYCSVCKDRISDRYGKYYYCSNCGTIMEESK